MNKISLIIKREYLTRVKKKSFLIMTVLGPLLMAAAMIVPIWLSQLKNEKLDVEVIDETSIFLNKLEESGNIHFNYTLSPVDSAKRTFFRQNDFNAILYIPRTVLTSPEGIFLYYKKEPGLLTKTYIEKQIQKELEKSKLRSSGIDDKLIAAIKSNVSITTVDIDENGFEKQSSQELAMIVGYAGGFIIYMFIFLYGAQVMRGVIEEKTNRIIEVMISSVRPFQLMMGKIVGIALVGLTQFMLWVVLTFTITTGVNSLILKNKYSSENLKQVLEQNAGDMNQKEQATVKSMVDIMGAIEQINFVLIIGCFLFYFLGGYLLYSALFAAVGSAVDNEADTQQFMLPVSIPLVIGIIMMQYVINNPEGPMAFWFSIIPLTSPIVMMARIPFGIAPWELLLSMIALVIGFVGITWIAGRIYRTGILMYGKKVTYKELWKWLFYKG